MHSHYSQHVVTNLELPQNRTARFEGGDVKRRLIENLDVRTNQYCISMPANTSLFGVKINRAQIAMFYQNVLRKCGFSFAKAPVRFLKCNDIGAKLVDDRQDALWPPKPVGADALADVIAGDPDHLTQLVASLAAAKPKR